MKKNIKESIHSLLGDFNFLPDKPLLGEKDNEVRFGHEQVANTLFRIVEKASSPFSIGLYGDWGSGKTTIIKLLEKRIKKEKSKIKFVYFDVWKYQEDELRREFLLQTAEQLGLKTEKTELEKRFYYSLRNTERNFKFDIRTFLLKKLPEIILIVLLFFVILLNLGDVEKWKEAFIILFAGFGAFDLFKGIKSFWGESLIIDEVFLTKDKLSEPEVFEDEFKKLVKKLKDNKGLFVIDNLDRAYRDKAIQILSVVKSFLEIDGCIFIIPCDEKAIKRHVEKQYFNSNTTENGDIKAYSDEFLRKFFNTVVRIPKTEDYELDTYIEDQLEETGIKQLKEDSQLVWLITYAFRNNPREIKQFVNNLVSALVLLEERLDNELFGKYVLEGDIAFLAKVLMLEQRYPDDYQKIKEGILSQALSWNEIETTYIVDGKIKDAAKFLNQTKQIVPQSSNLILFLIFKQSSEEKSLPGWEQFNIAAQDKNIEVANKFISSFKDENKLDEFDKLAANYMKRNSGREARTSPFASVCIDVFFRNKWVMPKRMAIEIALQVPSLLDTHSYVDFPINEVVSTLKDSVSKSQNEQLANSYIHLLGTQKNDGSPSIEKEHAQSIFKQVVLDNNYFDKRKADITRHLSEKFNGCDYLKIFADSECKLKFVTPKVVEKYISNISELLLDNEESLSNSLNLLTTLGHLDEGQQIALFEKYNSLIVRESIQTERAQRYVLGGEFLKFLIEYGKSIDELNNQDINTKISNISNLIATWYKQATDLDKKHIVFRLAFELWKLENNQVKTNLIQLMGNFSNIAEYDNGYNLLNAEELSHITQNYESDMFQAIIRDSRIFNTVKSQLTIGQIDKIVLQMIAVNQIEEALKIAEELKYGFENCQPILLGFFDKLPIMNETNKERVFLMSKKTKCGNDSSLEERYFKELLSIKSTEFGKSMVDKFVRGKRGLFSKAQRDELLEHQVV